MNDPEEKTNELKEKFGRCLCGADFYLWQDHDFWFWMCHDTIDGKHPQNKTNCVWRTNGLVFRNSAIQKNEMSFEDYERLHKLKAFQ